MTTVAQIQAQAIKEAGLDIWQADAAAKILARTLAKIHGGDWRIQVDDEFVIVARRSGRDAIQPKRGEVV